MTENPTDKILPLHFFISQFKVMVHYITIFVWPFTMSVEYDWKLVKGFFALDCIIPFCVLLSLAWYIMYRLRKNSIDLFAFAIMWFFITIVPRSSIIPSSELLVDYKTYIGSLAPAFLIATLLIYIGMFCSKYVATAVPATRHIYIQMACIGLCVTSLGMLTYERNKVWRSGEEFWFSIIQNAPGKARAYNNYGVALSEKGNSKDAIPYYQKAIAMDSLYPDPCNNLAVAYSQIGEIDKAIETLKQGIRIQPHYPEAYNNLASFLITKKDFAQAEQALNLAIQLRPHYGKAWLNKGKVHADQGNMLAAFECFKNACTKADLDNEVGFGVYANVSMAVKKYDDAIFAFKKLLEINPAPKYALGLAGAHFQNNNMPEAIALYQKVLQKNPHEIIALHNTGEAYMRSNEPEKALEYYKRAHNINKDLPNSGLRIAQCLMQLGRHQEAQETLELIIAQEGMNENYKNIARMALNESRLLKIQQG